MDDLKQKAKNLYENEQYDELDDFVEDQLKHQATENDIDVWITLAIAIVLVPIVDDEKSIACLEKALELDEKNPIALLILAYVYEHEKGGIHDALLHKIENLQTDSDEINSMLKYVASWSYASHKKNDPLMEEKLLKESIKLCGRHVWNYNNLARLNFSQGRDAEAHEFAKKAIANIQKIYTDRDLLDYHVPDIKDYLNEQIKGIYLTDSQVEFLEEMLDEKKSSTK